MLILILKIIDIINRKTSQTKTEIIITRNKTLLQYLTQLLSKQKP